MEFNQYAAKKHAAYCGATSGATLVVMMLLGVAETMLTGRSRIWRSGYMEAVTKVGVMATGGSYVLNGLLSNEVEKMYELDLETSQELDKIVANLEFIVQFGTSATKLRVKELISKHKLEDIVNLEADGFGIIEGFKAVKGSVTHTHKLLKFINDAFLALEMGH